MHFALPTKNHRSSPFQASVPRAYFSRRRPLYCLIFAVVVVVLLVTKSYSGGSGRPVDAPETVLVLVVNRTDYSAEHIAKIVQNRKEYARAHGYGLFVKDSKDYPIGPAPEGWARVPAMRHAMTEFPFSENFWYLDQNSIIMNPALSLESHILESKRLGAIMMRDVPVVPPDSVIRTYRHVPPERVQFILSQDHDGLQPGSMIIRRGMWAQYLLDSWYDPLFRFYNFQKAEQHALEHIVQWHPTILTKLALIPQKIFNSYPTPPGGEGSYEEGDFVVHFKGCEAAERNCEKEFARFWDKRAVLD